MRMPQACVVLVDANYDRGWMMSFCSLVLLDDGSSNNRINTNARPLLLSLLLPQNQQNAMNDDALCACKSATGAVAFVVMAALVAIASFRCAMRRWYMHRSRQWHPKKTDVVPHQVAQLEQQLRQRRDTSSSLSYTSSNNTIRKEHTSSINALKQQTDAPPACFSPKLAPQQRCPACRKTILADTEATIIRFQGNMIHRRCFTCCDCQELLPHHRHQQNQHDTQTSAAIDTNDHTSSIHVYKTNAVVRERYQCHGCYARFGGTRKHGALQSTLSSLSSRNSVDDDDDGNNKRRRRLPGEKIVIEDDEKGDLQHTLALIGDDLKEAVYFMQPKCCLCGGDLYNAKNTTRSQWQSAMTDYRRGNWRYHRDCWEQNGGSSMLNFHDTPKLLSPAHSAKHLSQLIILQLSQLPPTENSSLPSVSRTLVSPTTTLYFARKQNDNEIAVQLQKGKNTSNDTRIVTIPYSLDSQAPANPNYEHQPATELHSDGMTQYKAQKHKQQQHDRRHVANNHQRLQQGISLESFRSLRLAMLAAEQVAPLAPRMVGSASVVTVDDDDDDDDGAYPKTTHMFSAELEYMKFGLWYRVRLTIPVANVGTKSYQMTLIKAALAITISE